MRYGKFRKSGSPPLTRESRLAVLRDAHLVWALNEKIFDAETGEVFESFEPIAYHIEMAKLYQAKLDSCLLT